MCFTPQIRRPIGRRTDKAARASDGESHFTLTHKSGDIEMLLFIILALLVILAKSLMPLAAADADVTFDAAVAIAGLLSYVAMFGYIFWPPKTNGKSLDRSRRDASVAEGHFEMLDHLQQDIAVRPAGRAVAGSGLVRRLVRAKDDPAKQRIRAQLSEIDDERLLRLGLTSEDIAALRGTASPQVEATIAQALDAPSEDGCTYQHSPSIAGVSDATDHALYHESDTSRRERVSDC
ncbi:hypothetical protein Q3C01_14905 [Bradyrhizobium sp. UFLA05-109]